MKKLLPLFALLCVTTYSPAQTINWYYTTDGVTGSGWPKYDVFVPDGIRVDSVYGGFDRPGVLEDSEDYASSFTPTIGPVVSPWDYNDTMTTLYDHWINLLPLNLVGEGVFRAAIPDGANPGEWDSLGVAITSTLWIDSQDDNGLVLLYPNPTMDILNIQVVGTHIYNMYDVLGNLVMQGQIDGVAAIDVQGLNSGVYVIQVGTLCRMKFVRQ